jgi:hypothetical protein
MQVNFYLNFIKMGKTLYKRMQKKNLKYKNWSSYRIIFDIGFLLWLRWWQSSALKQKRAWDDDDKREEK